MLRDGIWSRLRVVDKLVDLRGFGSGFALYMDGCLFCRRIILWTLEFLVLTPCVLSSLYRIASCIYTEGRVGYRITFLILSSLDQLNDSKTTLSDSLRNTEKDLLHGAFFFGTSFVKGMKSRPCMYGRNTSGMTNPSGVW